MEKRTTVILGLLAVATAALGIHLLRTRRARRTAAMRWHPSGSLFTGHDDPFADMIEEGAGLLGQLKAETEELARKAGLV